MYELRIDDRPPAECWVCDSQYCSRGDHQSHLAYGHGGPIITYRVKAWQFWRPTLENAAMRSLRGARKVAERAEREKAERDAVAERVKSIQQKVQLAQHPLVDAMLKSQGQ